MKDGYYIGYGWHGDCQILYTRIEDYKTALRMALGSHKEEIEYQKDIRGKKEGDVMNMYVVLFYHGNQYIIAEISGWKPKVTEYEYE